MNPAGLSCYLIVQDLHWIRIKQGVYDPALDTDHAENSWSRIEYGSRRKRMTPHWIRIMQEMDSSVFGTDHAGNAWDLTCIRQRVYMAEEQNIYPFDSRVRYSEVGEDFRLTPGALIDYFQDCSTLHAEDRGVGVRYLKERGQAWITVSWQICITRMPELGEQIRTKTWAFNFRDFYGKRNYLLEDGAGAECVRAMGLWVLMDMKKGVPVRIPEDMIRVYGTEPRLEMEQVSRKIRMPSENVTPEEPFHVGRQHLDTNHHVNNAQYISMAADYLPGDFRIGEIRAEYRQQAKLGDLICPHIAGTQNGYVLSLDNEEGRSYAVISFSAR